MFVELKPHLQSAVVAKHVPQTSINFANYLKWSFWGTKATISGKLFISLPLIFSVTKNLKSLYYWITTCSCWKICLYFEQNILHVFDIIIQLMHVKLLMTSAMITASTFHLRHSERGKCIFISGLRVLSHAFCFLTSLNHLPQSKYQTYDILNYEQHAVF